MSRHHRFTPDRHVPEADKQAEREPFSFSDAFSPPVVGPKSDVRNFSTPRRLDRTGFMDGTDRQKPPEKVESVSKIEWQKDLYGAYAQAMKENKPLIVMFSTDWCGYCKKLETEVLNKPEMEKFSKSGIFVKVDPEKSQDAADLVKSLDITGYPSVVVLDAKKDALNERGRVVGFLDLEKFSTQLAKYLPEEKPKTPAPAPDRDPLDEAPMRPAARYALDSPDERKDKHCCGDNDTVTAMAQRPEPASWLFLPSIYDNIMTSLPKWSPAELTAPRSETPQQSGAYSNLWVSQWLSGIFA